LEAEHALLEFLGCVHGCCCIVVVEPITLGLKQLIDVDASSNTGINDARLLDGYDSLSTYCTPCLLYQVGEFFGTQPVILLSVSATTRAIGSCPNRLDEKLLIELLRQIELVLVNKRAVSHL